MNIEPPSTAAIRVSCSARVIRLLANLPGGCGWTVLGGVQTDQPHTVDTLSCRRNRSRRCRCIRHRLLVRSSSSCSFSFVGCSRSSQQQQIVTPGSACMHEIVWTFWLRRLPIRFLHPYRDTARIMNTGRPPVLSRVHANNQPAVATLPPDLSELRPLNPSLRVRLRDYARRVADDDAARTEVAALSRHLASPLLPPVDQQARRGRHPRCSLASGPQR